MGWGVPMLSQRSAGSNGFSDLEKSAVLTVSSWIRVSMLYLRGHPSKLEGVLGQDTLILSGPKAPEHRTRGKAQDGQG